MNSVPVVLEISSDEDGDNWDEPNDDQIDWLSELFDSPESINEDSDDVVFVGEIAGNSAIQKKSSKPLDSAKHAEVGGDSDDDCLILDKDPDNQVSVVNDTENGSDSSEELLIVGEKGQLACRDYPHPRHLCATFPFSSSPHEKYCALCHCYVCDSRAPCAYWGTGISKTDHCHSTDKEEIWKIQRQCFKQSTMAQPLLRKHPETTLSAVLPLHKSGPTLSVPTLSVPTLSEPLDRGSFPLRSVSSCTIRAGSSMPTSFGVPSIISRRNNQGSTLTAGSNRFPQHTNRSQIMLAGTGNNINITKRRPHFVPPHRNFKRIGSVGTGAGAGALANNRYTYSSPNTNNHMYKSQPPRTYLPPVARHDGIHSQRGQGLLQEALESETGTCRSYSQPNPSSNSADPNSYHQPRVFSSLPNENLYMYQNQHAVPNVTDQNPQYDFGWLDDMANEGPFPIAETSQTPGLHPTSNPLSVAETSYQSHLSMNPVEPDLNSWLDSLDSLENQPSLGPANDTVPSQLDFVTAQADMIDERVLLFDFENC